MQANRSSSSISLAAVIPPVLRPWTEPLEPALRRMLIPGELMSGLEAARKSGIGAQFARACLNRWTYASWWTRTTCASPRSRTRHRRRQSPRGIVEGLVLMSLLIASVRRENARQLDGRLDPEIRVQTILVIPSKPAPPTSRTGPAREALAWLSRGGLLSLFPPEKSPSSTGSSTL